MVLELSWWVGVTCRVASLLWQKMAPIPVITIATMVITVVVADGLHWHQCHCHCDHPHCGSRWLTSPLSLPLWPSSSLMSFSLCWCSHMALACVGGVPGG